MEINSKHYIASHKCFIHATNCMFAMRVTRFTTNDQCTSIRFVFFFIIIFLIWTIFNSIFVDSLMKPDKSTHNRSLPTSKPIQSNPQQLIIKVIGSSDDHHNCKLQTHNHSKYYCSYWLLLPNRTSAAQTVHKSAFQMNAVFVNIFEPCHIFTKCWNVQWYFWVWVSFLFNFWCILILDVLTILWISISILFGIWDCVSLGVFVCVCERCTVHRAFV